MQRFLLRARPLRHQIQRYWCRQYRLVCTPSSRRRSECVRGQAAHTIAASALDVEMNSSNREPQVQPMYNVSHVAGPAFASELINLIHCSPCVLLISPAFCTRANRFTFAPLSLAEGLTRVSGFPRRSDPIRSVTAPSCRLRQLASTSVGRPASRAALEH